jgi:hypothetical protein
MLPETNIVAWTSDIFFIGLLKTNLVSLLRTGAFLLTRQEVAQAAYAMAPAGNTVLPTSPAMIRFRSAKAPMAAGFPVAAANRHAASTFGPIEPAAKEIPTRAFGEVLRIGLYVGFPQSV